jgi:hypothetical protein
MALWQAVSWLVPASAIDIDPESAWLGHADSARALTLIGSLLPSTPSSYGDSLHWGDYESHDIEGFREDGQLAGIRIRIDVRDDGTEQFIVSLSRVVTALGGILVDSEGRALPASVEGLAAHIRGSGAVRFVDDPETYLADPLNRVEEGKRPLTAQEVERLVLDEIGGDWDRAGMHSLDLRQCLVSPPRVETYWLTTPGTEQPLLLWLVAQESSKELGGYEVVYDESDGMFGLGMLDRDGIRHHIGDYGGFWDALEGM